MNWNKKSRQIWTRIKKEQKEVGNGNQDVSSERKKKEKKRKRKRRKWKKNFRKNQMAVSTWAAARLLLVRNQRGSPSTAKGGLSFPFFPLCTITSSMAPKTSSLTKLQRLSCIVLYLIAHLKSICGWVTAPSHPPPCTFYFKISFNYSFIVFVGI